MLAANIHDVFLDRPLRAEISQAVHRYRELASPSCSVKSSTIAVEPRQRARENRCSVEMRAANRAGHVNLVTVQSAPATKLQQLGLAIAFGLGMLVTCAIG